MRLKSPDHLVQFAGFIEANFGVTVPLAKQAALSSKLHRLMARNHVDSLETLYDIINEQSDTKLYQEFVDVVTTHKTDFFRERDHFDFIINTMKTMIRENQQIRDNREIRVWSAACSTGEEPYTLAMVLSECVPPEYRIKILATDLSIGSLRIASKGIYLNDNVSTMGTYYRNKYFNKLDHHHYQASETLRDLITFRSFNLLDQYPFKGTFDIIFCRNVMIYFNLETQETILEKMHAVTELNGYFVIGMSEGLLTKKQKFTYVRPSVYKKTKN